MRHHAARPSVRLAGQPRSARGLPALILLSAIVVAALALTPATAAAVPAGGGGLAWEGPMAMIVSSITGPVAMGVSLLGVVGTGATLIWGGEINEFIRRIVMVVLVIALIVAAASILATLFGVGAVIPLPPAGSVR
jgi:type IV secretion system protein VirB2